MMILICQTSKIGPRLRLYPTQRREKDPRPEGVRHIHGLSSGQCMWPLFLFVARSEWVNQMQG